MIKDAKKIAIIGNAGSGKTTVALALHEKLQLPQYHLDQYYWLPHWERPALEEFIEKHRELCTQEQWILDGSYMATLPERIDNADVIIYLDIPRYLCIWRVFKRSLLNHGKSTPDTPAGCKQYLFSRKFISFLGWVWSYNKRYRVDIINMLRAVEHEKTVIVVASNKKLQELQQIFFCLNP